MTSSRKVAGVLVKCRDRVLLLKRCIKGTELEGYWSIPCGMVENKESIWAAAARELYEETLILTEHDLTYVHRFKISNKREFYCYLYSASKEIKPDIITARDGYEHSDWKYFPILDLPEPIDANLKKAILMSKKM